MTIETSSTTNAHCASCTHQKIGHRLHCMTAMRCVSNAYAHIVHTTHSHAFTHFFSSEFCGGAATRVQPSRVSTKRLNERTHIVPCSDVRNCVCVFIHIVIHLYWISHGLLRHIFESNEKKNSKYFDRIETSWSVASSTHSRHSRQRGRRTNTHKPINDIIAKQFTLISKLVVRKLLLWIQFKRIYTVAVSCWPAAVAAASDGRP